MLESFYNFIAIEGMAEAAPACMCRQTSRSTLTQAGGGAATSLQSASMRPVPQRLASLLLKGCSLLWCAALYNPEDGLFISVIIVWVLIAL